MFEVLKNDDLNEWNLLSLEEKNNYISNGEIDLAFDIEIIISNDHEVYEEHKYYKVNKYSKNLLPIIEIKEINLNEVKLEVRDEIYSIKISEERNVEFGNAPYKTNVKIIISNIYVGRIAEL